jgi:hypothetical protein
MADFDYDIAGLPDYPALQQLARALWRNGSVRGASILVGAGLSKNAERPGADSPEPPLWWELLKEMVERLYPHDKDAAPSNPLRIAEEYRTYFGQAGLDDFLRTRFPDRSWTPGPLHRDLLQLPWADVLTTNWDTLLERAAENSVDYSYEVVRTEADLTYAKSPRIVKLHGTIGDPGPLIFAEEDYRTYPAKYAAFVNFARQVFIENELCLVGFSGDDPNFLQWAGWVRDHLGGSARRIYLVGNLRLERATRRYLEAHNIAPIDLAPLVNGLPRKLPPFPFSDSGRLGSHRATRDRSSPQLFMQKFACSPVRQCRGRRIVVKPVMPRERVTLARITVNGSIRLIGECCFDRNLCRLGDKFVLFTEVHQQRSAQPANLAEIFFSVAAMVSDRSIDLIAGGYDKSHQRAEAVALHGNLAGRLRKLSSRANCFLDIFRAGIAVISSVKPQTVLPVCVGSDIKIDARFLPPE